MSYVRNRAAEILVTLAGKLLPSAFDSTRHKWVASMGGSYFRYRSIRPLKFSDIKSLKTMIGKLTKNDDYQLQLWIGEVTYEPNDNYLFNSPSWDLVKSSYHALDSDSLDDQIRRLSSYERRMLVVKLSRQEEYGYLVIRSGDRRNPPTTLLYGEEDNQKIILSSLASSCDSMISYPHFLDRQTEIVPPIDAEGLYAQEYQKRRGRRDTWRSIGIAFATTIITKILSLPFDLPL